MFLILDIGDLCNLYYSYYEQSPFFYNIDNDFRVSPNLSTVKSVKNREHGAKCGPQNILIHSILKYFLKCYVGCILDWLFQCPQHRYDFALDSQAASF